LTHHFHSFAGSVLSTVSAHGCTKHSSKGRPLPRCQGRDCGAFPRARETHPYPRAGSSKRRDHARKRSQFSDSSAEGQPLGGVSMAFLKGSPYAEARAGGESKRMGSGTLASGRFPGSKASDRQGVAETLAPGCPSSATGSPARVGGSLTPRRDGARQDALAHPGEGFVSTGEEAAFVEDLALTQ
jgi:hypothetical protein